MVDTDAVREVALGRLGINQAEHELLMAAAAEIDQLRERLRRASEELKDAEKRRVWREAAEEKDDEEEPT